MLVIRRCSEQFRANLTFRMFFFQFYGLVVRKNYLTLSDKGIHLVSIFTILKPGNITFNIEPVATFLTYNIG